MDLQEATDWLEYCVDNPGGEVNPAAAEFLLAAMATAMTALQRLAPEVNWVRMVDPA